MIYLLAVDWVCSGPHDCKQMCMDNGGFRNVIAIISTLNVKVHFQVLLLR